MISSFKYLRKSLFWVTFWSSGSNKVQRISNSFFLNSIRLTFSLHILHKVYKKCLKIFLASKGISKVCSFPFFFYWAFLQIDFMSLFFCSLTLIFTNYFFFFGRQFLYFFSLPFSPHAFFPWRNPGIPRKVKNTENFLNAFFQKNPRFSNTAKKSNTVFARFSSKKIFSSMNCIIYYFLM